MDDGIIAENFSLVHGRRVVASAATNAALRCRAHRHHPKVFFANFLNTFQRRFPPRLVATEVGATELPRCFKLNFQSGIHHDAGLTRAGWIWDWSEVFDLMLLILRRRILSSSVYKEIECRDRKTGPNCFVLVVWTELFLANGLEKRRLDLTPKAMELPRSRRRRRRGRIVRISISMRKPLRRC